MAASRSRNERLKFKHLIPWPLSLSDHHVAAIVPATPHFNGTGSIGCGDSCWLTRPLLTRSNDVGRPQSADAGLAYTPFSALRVLCLKLGLEDRVSSCRGSREARPERGVPHQSAQAGLRPTKEAPTSQSLQAG